MITIDITEENNLQAGLFTVKTKCRNKDKEESSSFIEDHGTISVRAYERKEPREEFTVLLTESQLDEFTNWMRGPRSISFGHKQEKIKDINIDVVKLYGRAMYFKVKV